MNAEHNLSSLHITQTCCVYDEGEQDYCRKPTVAVICYPVYPKTSDCGPHHLSVCERHTPLGDAVPLDPIVHPYGRSVVG